MAIRDHGEMKPSISISQDNVYEIKVNGFLDDCWKQYFEGMILRREENGELGQAYTCFTGPIADQPALYGLLAKIRDLNLTLVSVRKIVVKRLDDQGSDQNAE